MKRKYDIIRFAALLLLAAGCFHSCRQNDFDDFQPDDRQSLIASGRYLASAVTPANAAEEPNFEPGTPYRLLAFAKPYSEVEAVDETTVADEPRFNKVAWEGETASGLRFINIESDPDKWFGFSALGDETPGDDGLVSLDFYGFTYGEKRDDRPQDYIALDGLPEQEQLPDRETQPLSSLKRTETVSDDGVLNDLMRGALLNQNIATVGSGATGTQSVIPFAHCFSKLRFKVSQQKDDDGNLCFKHIVVTNVTLTNTFNRGSVYLRSGKVELDPTAQREERRRELTLTSTNKVTAEEVPIGEMLVFPSDGNDLTDASKLPDGYDVGLEITVTCSDKKDMENFLRNTGGDPAAVTEEADGRWSGKIVKEHLLDFEANKHLHFKQNTIYTLVIWFVKDAVRIITVVPQVEPWIPGEVNDKDEPWADLEMGQPQMFDNVVWSDRNVGADHYDPTVPGSFEKTAGYFFQAGRNIPYYPFNYNDGVPDYATMIEKMNGQLLSAEITDWSQSSFRFYPIVDRRILRMTGNKYWVMSGGKPQMVIPESQPKDAYFDFMNGLGSTDDAKWELGPQNQPVAGLWKVPSAREFMTVFPSTPFAGNIVFNKIGGEHLLLHDWGCDGTNERDFQMEEPTPEHPERTDVLRVTVPYYTSDMYEQTVETHTFPEGKDDDYKDAWETLRSHNDQGTTHLEQYIYNKKSGDPGHKDALKLEPMGDPAPGYASVYIISRAGDDKVTLSPDFLKQADPNNNRFVVKSWGTIYAIKRAYTPEAYRMRWRTKIAKFGTKNPCIYIEVCRYRCTEYDTLTEENYKDYDWEHPAARIYFPICGMGDYTGEYINFGMECVYATSDPIKNGKVNAVQLKITGNNASNAYIAVVEGELNRNFGMQIRPVMRGGRITDNE